MYIYIYIISINWPSEKTPHQRLDVVWNPLHKVGGILVLHVQHLLIDLEFVPHDDTEETHGRDEKGWWLIKCSMTLDNIFLKSPENTMRKARCFLWLDIPPPWSTSVHGTRPPPSSSDHGEDRQRTSCFWHPQSRIWSDATDQLFTTNTGIYTKWCLPIRFQTPHLQEFDCPKPGLVEL